MSLASPFFVGDLYLGGSTVTRAGWTLGGGGECKLSALGVASAALWIGVAAAQSSPPQPTVAGWVEAITFPDYVVSIDAPLDTGADFSSVGVTDLHPFEKDGKLWFRFGLSGVDGRTATVQRPSDRVLHVKQAAVSETRRPIVRLRVCIAGQVAETDFSLTDRKK